MEAFYALKHLEAAGRPPHVVWDPMWRMTYAENPGAAWGMLPRPPGRVPPRLLRGHDARARWASSSATTASSGSDQRFMQVALSFVLSGAVGNLIDRLARGYVVDFIQWHWWNRPDLYWPIFNLADSLIVVGVRLLLLHPGAEKGEAERGHA